jgi:serine protease Do
VHAEELPRLAARHRPGERVPIEALRDGKARILTVTLGELRDEAPQPVGGGPAAPEAPGPATAGPLGVALADGPNGGAMVQRVRPHGAADGVLEPGDVILEVDRAPVRRSDDVRARVRAAAGRTILLRVRRGRTTRYVAVDLGTRSGR